VDTFADCDCEESPKGQAADINAILSDLKTSYVHPNCVACTVKLEGGTNAAPTWQGITDKTFKSITDGR
jgi:hypothetical protein